MPGFDKSQALYQRARKVIPGGIPGHQTPGLMRRGESPCFIEKAEGCRFWDVDGNTYIDYMCAYGPMILGYNHPKVEEAVQKQRLKGNCFNLPSPLLVELAEYLVALVPSADWTVFGKNGSDVTNYACQVARAHTGKKKIIMAEGAYHGIGAWCNPNTTGITEEDRVNVLTFPYNDPQALQNVVKANKDDVAGLILSPFRHDAFHDQEMPTESFLQGLRALCNPEGPVLIIDDVRAGFRLDLRGSAAYFNLHPQLNCFSKALGNGYPISACLGNKALMPSARKVYFTGSFFMSGVPMAAALATLREMAETKAVEHMFRMGEELKQGLIEQADSLKLEIHYTGPVTLPFMTFANDPAFDKAKTFCARAAQEGVFFHPSHNWFLSAAHGEEEIKQTLRATQQAFEEVKEQFA
jgi:glutamate-1-semialdehyde 2,1-aminomutase